MRRLRLWVPYFCGSIWSLLAVAGPLYGKPPCQAGETYAHLYQERVLCTSPCVHNADCPTGKADGVFADPQCVLVSNATAAENSTAGAQQKFCGLWCTSDSYCPKGGRCTKGKADSMVANGIKDSLKDFFKGVDVDQFRGVCTFKPKASRSEYDWKKVREVQLSTELAKGLFEGYKEAMGMPPHMEF
eukprot:gnl/TRDRNA2_/TRDRNA2_193278_c0_seq1.p1 gnl/TRDRNA2_/TRDRNA2_193278_c0~~gnl/TRDRNA2_/TRDRNA2_193278_c0_seq1.p1  ORF type:complete len:187 (+),score=40.77 gnl/TRDRNA2_/TRDRNA2_193278_c0_seq1:60-620(+)